MAGTIAVESESGVGTTFTVELPRAEDPLAALEAVPAGPAPQAGRTATILYIEDNLANLKLVERALARRPGLTMLEATHGRRGLELARERRPDLVLLDLHLPESPARCSTAGLEPRRGSVVVVAQQRQGRVHPLPARRATT
jgi:PleD family two-component response regulator